MGGKRTLKGYGSAMSRAFSLVACVWALLSGCAVVHPTHNLFAPPDEAFAGQLRAAIWNDVQSNALIGNGNDLLFLWANAAVDRDNPPKLRIQDLRCGLGSTRLRCQFALLRDGGIAIHLGEPAPDRLACSAWFRRSGRDEGWSIPWLPPGPDDAHSRITIECDPVH